MPLLAILAAATVSAGVNKWTNVGPEGGGARFLAIDPQNPSTVYAGTAAGVFKSKDGGANWSNAGLIGFSVSSLAIDPQNPGTLYAVNAFCCPPPSVPIFKSTDGGASWNAANTGLPAN